IRTVRVDDALRTLRLARRADPPPMKLQQVAEVYPLLLGDHARQIGFDLIGIGLACQTEPLRQARHVRIDPDRRLSEGVTEQNVGGLAADAVQAGQRLDGLRHLAVETLDELLTAALHGPRFVAVETGWPHIRLQLFDGHAHKVGGRAVLLEERRRDLIDLLVGTLRRQNQRDEQFEGRGKIERQLGVRMRPLEALDDLPYSLAVCDRPRHRDAPVACTAYPPVTWRDLLEPLHRRNACVIAHSNVAGIGAAAIVEPHLRPASAPLTQTVDPVRIELMSTRQDLRWIDAAAAV